jgi:hypothetical protein
MERADGKRRTCRSGPGKRRSTRAAVDALLTGADLVVELAAGL